MNTHRLQSEILEALKNTPAHLYTHTYVEALCCEEYHKNAQEHGVAVALAAWPSVYASIWKRVLPRDRFVRVPCKACGSYYAMHAMAGTDPHAVDEGTRDQLRRVTKMRVLAPKRLGTITT